MQTACVLTVSVNWMEPAIPCNSLRSELENTGRDATAAITPSRQVARLRACLSEAPAALQGFECYSACNFDPLSWGIGVQNLEAD